LDSRRLDRTFGSGFAKRAGGHFAADIGQRAYHRQSFAITPHMPLMLVQVPRQQRVLYLVTVKRVQLPGRHHAIQH